jgi:2-polyprenyl-6-methoxyphenol hydroxylase-like FAD-dependent oxidoreductase
MRVVVAGGGIGGMAAAVALTNVGVEPLVLEQAGADREIGAGLGLAANAMKAMTWLGAADFLRERAVRTEANVWCELESGARIGFQPFALADERYGERYYTARRGGLLDSLVRLVPPAPCGAAGRARCRFRPRDRTA